MNYTIIIEKEAQKEAEAITKKYRMALDRKIFSLASDPRPRGSKKLTEKEGYRIRVGTYLILYTIDDKTKAVII